MFIYIYAAQFINSMRVLCLILTFYGLRLVFIRDASLAHVAFIIFAQFSLKEILFPLQAH